MKTKKFIAIITLCLLFGGQLYAAGDHVNMKERTESWLKNSSIEKQNQPSPEPSGLGQGGGRTGGGGASDDPTVGPIQDALPVMLLLMGVYFIVCKRKNFALQKKMNEK
jgi:hypothetical protein